MADSASGAKSRGHSLPIHAAWDSNEDAWRARNARRHETRSPFAAFMRSAREHGAHTRARDATRGVAASRLLRAVNREDVMRSAGRRRPRAPRPWVVRIRGVLR